ncbi:MAG TPA: PAS domain-containing protein [Polyangiaceae bacterium]|jgi:PAS domain S-box-containing protein
METLLSAADVQAWATLDAVPAAIVVVDAAARVVFANASAADLFDHPSETLRGTPIDALIAGPCRAWWADQARRPPRDDGDEAPASREVLSARRSDGRELLVQASLRSAVTPNGPRVVAVLSDVTETHRSETIHVAAAAEAREKQAQLETLLAFAPAIILAVSPEGIIDYINQVLPPWTREEVIGSFWLNYIPPELQVRMTSALGSVLRTGSSETFETAAKNGEGTADTWYWSHLGPIREGDRIVGAVVVAQDITKRRRAETELLAAQRMAVLGTLAAGVAHEINTPIQFVGDSIRFLSDAATDLLALFDRMGALRAMLVEGRPVADAVAAAVKAEEDADLPYIRAKMPAAFDRCIDGLNRVTAIVRSLKEFAHPADPKPTPADLNHAIESTLTIAANEYKYVADLETDFGDLPPVLCHVGEINQAILNIVVNASHAIGNVVQGTDGKGRIRVRTFREGDQAVVAIGDTGGGIPETIRARIFDPFFTTKEVGKGTGQGLAIAWSVINEKHGGELTFETHVGAGTTFFIRLPIGGKPATEHAGAAATSLAS